ncbi:hypothetical protein OH77DRAFT_1286750 [Trametes cingulata]|nr:hypothetical protein OH77DRAFT_1286750 [Trametes cingulata]
MTPKHTQSDPLDQQTAHDTARSQLVTCCTSVLICSLATLLESLLLASGARSEAGRAARLVYTEQDKPLASGIRLSSSTCHPHYTMIVTLRRPTGRRNDECKVNLSIMFRRHKWSTSPCGSALLVRDIASACAANTCKAKIPAAAQALRWC